MFERIMRSPLFSSLALISVGFVVLAGQLANSDVDYFTFDTERLVFFSWVFFLLWLIPYTALLFVYNQKHPNKRIKYFTLMPVEFQEADEGEQWVTYRACRKAYIFIYSAIPAALGILFALHTFPFYEFLPTILLVLIGIGQYIAYWTEIRKLYQS
ncbi:hypothetical protein [Desulfuribacillus alkaliarsenatis]|uniref:DUF2178 domain-containing protein n=1 Tax=Desulfuribacillus alkaliarsenatis TaxID=766136 RepID=A0A1E5G3H9_9FIRM|nr:hypothetical protein [Desulfuribacillus alkaliarsenatis]OEF97606.1 hypothetical protein BHF68_14710 [Desulfuribacillus alkaliarsenatis]